MTQLSLFDEKNDPVFEQDFEKGVKFCNTCKKDLPVAKFSFWWSASYGKDKRNSSCRDCTNEHRKILDNINFTINPGETAAIVGPTGAGKSTISRLLFRFYDVEKGNIFIDDQDIREFTQTSLRHNIGIIPQDTVLFNQTILYNIKYGRWTASNEDVFLASEQAQLKDFIKSLPNGYNTIVGERGLKLSGGEKQRIAIARTLLKGPPILVLDEATSSLDTLTEKEIKESLDGLSEKRTTLIIAHRLSTIVDADKILVIDKGKIIEIGDHQTLMEKNGLYTDMWLAQQAIAKAQETLKNVKPEYKKLINNNIELK